MKTEIEKKLSDAIAEMIGTDLKKCTYYHKAATFVETERGCFMIRVVPYDPPVVVMDENF